MHKFSLSELNEDQEYAVQAFLASSVRLRIGDRTFLVLRSWLVSFAHILLFLFLHRVPGGPLIPNVYATFEVTQLAARFGQFLALYEQLLGPRGFLLRYCLRLRPNCRQLPASFAISGASKMQVSMARLVSRTCALHLHEKIGSVLVRNEVFVIS